MKRFLCQSHGHHLAKCHTRWGVFPGTTATCTICRWEARPWTLGDFASELRDISENMAFCQQDEYYDPHGITYAQQFCNVMRQWVKMIHPAYAKNLMKELNEEYQAKDFGPHDQK